MNRIYKKAEVSESEIFSRDGGTTDVSAIVADIIAEVRERGDAALREYSEKFDRAKLDALEVTCVRIKDERGDVVTGVVAELFHLLVEDINRRTTGTADADDENVFHLFSPLCDLFYFLFWNYFVARNFIA